MFGNSMTTVTRNSHLHSWTFCQWSLHDKLSPDKEVFRHSKCGMCQALRSPRDLVDLDQSHLEPSPTSPAFLRPCLSNNIPVSSCIMACAWPCTLMNPGLTSWPVSGPPMPPGMCPVRWTWGLCRHRNGNHMHSGWGAFCKAACGMSAQLQFLVLKPINVIML